MNKTNNMCLNCRRLNSDCSGTTCQTWTGCVYYQEDTNKRIWNFYKRDLIKTTKFTDRKENKIRFNVIQYVCSFPAIDPVAMAAELQNDGFIILYDDSSISAKANAAHRAAVNRIAKQ